ncbi:CPBP family intramembrane glutamic endopeptidase [Streptomyces sp. NPDC002851]
MRIFLVVAVLAVTNTVSHRLPSEAYVPLCVTVAALLLLIARWDGVTRAGLGLARETVRRGLVWALVLVGGVLLVYGIGLAIPVTRDAFLDDRVAHLSAGEVAYRALVRVPLGTVLLEEVAFRGVLWAMLTRRWGPTWATAVSSVLFGLWHIQPSLGLSRSNAAIGATFGSGGSGVVLSVAAAVVVSGIGGVVFCELRRRSGSLIPPVALHCALNSAGYVLAWAAARWWAGS